MDSLYSRTIYSRAMQCQDRVEFTVTNKESKILSFRITQREEFLNAQTRTDERKITGNFGMLCVSNHQMEKRRIPPLYVRRT